MFFYRQKEKCKKIASFACVLFFSAFFWLIGAFSLPASATSREYYLYDPSSQATIQTELAPVDLLYVCGESAEYEREDVAEFLEEILKTYRAEILFTEEACGVRSYYCYSPRLGKTTLLKGCAVNLHIACKGSRVKVGTPVIFGGY